MGLGANLIPANHPISSRITVYLMDCNNIQILLQTSGTQQFTIKALWTVSLIYTVCVNVLHMRF